MMCIYYLLLRESESRLIVYSTINHDKNSSIKSLCCSRHTPTEQNMASQYQKDQIETTMFPLTIRTIIKNIDEMSFKCPLTWNVAQLKLFIEMNHKNGSNYLRSDKIKLIYQGRFLSDQEPLAEVLRGVNILVL
jgi:hypothetical protein